MQLKLNSIKNKKTVFILFVLTAVLLLGVTASFANKFIPEEYDVTINYILSEADEPFEVYSEKHENGEQIIINSPIIDGYTADKENIAAVVKSNLYITVTYSCLHLNYSDAVTDIENEVNVYTCLTCGEKKNVGLDVTRGEFVFGGEAYLKGLSSSNCNEFGYQYSSGSVKSTLFINAEYTESLSKVFEKKIFDTDSQENLLCDNVIFEIDYDESVWGENAFTLRRFDSQTVVNPYILRLGRTWRIAFSLKDGSSVKTWLAKEDCPLKISPITVKVIHYEEIK